MIYIIVNIFGQSGLYILEDIESTQHTQRYPGFSISGIPITTEILFKCCLSKEFFHDGVIIYKFGLFDFWVQGSDPWINREYKGMVARNTIPTPITKPFLLTNK